MTEALGIHNVVRKEHMLDGFTETIHIRDLDKIYEVVKGFTGDNYG
jgi:hypothetical protein